MCKGVNAEEVHNAVSVRACLRILKKANYFTSTDVIHMQYVLKKIGCEELFEKCLEYAKEEDAFCFHNMPPGNVFINYYKERCLQIKHYDI